MIVIVVLFQNKVQLSGLHRSIAVKYLNVSINSKLKPYF